MLDITGSDVYDISDNIFINAFIWLESVIIFSIESFSWYSLDIFILFVFAIAVLKLIMSRGTKNKSIMPINDKTNII